MRRVAWVLGLTCVALLGNVSFSHAQLAVRVKAGTTGVGGDVSMSIMPRIALRAGATMMPVKPEGTFSDVSYQVRLPSPLFTAGADLYLLGGVRLMGGVLIGADQTDITGIYNGSVNLGGQQYSGTDLGQLFGVVTSKNLAPFAGVGFGKTVGPGIGLSLDVAGAFMGAPSLALSANGPCMTNPICGPQLQQSLDQEEAEMQPDVEKYGKIFPMVSLGIRFGFGG
jgi:hypothetical protein